MRESGSKTKVSSLVAVALGAFALWPATASAQSDLSIDVADSADPVTVGTEFTYTVAVINGGPDTANGVEVTNSLAKEVDFVSAAVATYAQGGCNVQGSRRVECSLGNLPSGIRAEITIRVRASRDGQAKNVASVSATSPNDPTSGNNEDTETTQIVDANASTCAGKNVTIVGTSGADVISGTPQRDVIAGLGGDDVINALEGKDTVCSGGGNDVIRGLGANDLIKGGPGNDRSRGGEGNDTIAGNGGDDNLGGGVGDDVLRGGRGIDRCRGGPGTDTRLGCE